MIDIMDIIGKGINSVFEFTALAFKEGWLYYIIGGLFVFIIIIIFF